MLSKVGVILQVIIVIMLAIIIALIIYYGTNSAKPVKAPAVMTPVYSAPAAHSPLDDHFLSTVAGASFPNHRA